MVLWRVALWFLLLTFWTWRWRQYIPTKHWQTFTRLYGIIPKSTLLRPTRSRITYIWLVQPWHRHIASKETREELIIVIRFNLKKIPWKVLSDSALKKITHHFYKKHGSSVLINLQGVCAILDTHTHTHTIPKKV